MIAESECPEMAAPEPFPLREKSLSRNFAWTLAGNLVNCASQWGIIMVLAKFGDTAMVGQFAFAVAITGPIMVLAGCALRTVQATDTANDFTFGDYLGFRLLALTLALLVILGITLGMDASSATAGVVIAVGLAKVFESISDLFHGALQQHEHMDRIGKSLILRGTVSLAVVIFTAVIASHVISERLALVVATSMAICWGITLLTIDVRVARQLGTQSLRPRMETVRLLKLGQLLVPLGLTVVLGSLIINMPRYVIEHYLGNEELGIYAALAYFALVGNMIANALANAVMPRLSLYWANGFVSQFRGLLARISMIGGILGLAGIALAMFAGETILTLAYRPEYARHNDVFTLLIISTALSFQVCFLDTAIYATRCFRVHIPINVMVVLLAFGMSMMWIPEYGLLGAAWAACAATGTQALARFVFVSWIVFRREEQVAPACSLPRC